MHLLLEYHLKTAPFKTPHTTPERYESNDFIPEKYGASKELSQTENTEKTFKIGSINLISLKKMSKHCMHNMLKRTL